MDRPLRIKSDITTLPYSYYHILLIWINKTDLKLSILIDRHQGSNPGDKSSKYELIYTISLCSNLHSDI